MSRLALVLALALAACGRKTPPPQARTADALGAELATYKQVLVPLSPKTAENIKHAAELYGEANVKPGDFEAVYAKAPITIDGSTAPALIAYSGAWLMPQALSARPMTPTQFLRQFNSDPECRAAVLITTKGTLIVMRAEAIDALVATRAAAGAGAGAEDLPFTIIRGAGK